MKSFRGQGHDGLQAYCWQRWENELRVEMEKEQSMQSTSGHVRGESLVQADHRKDKIESEWHEGLWLGQRRSTNDTIVGTAEGVVPIICDEKTRREREMERRLRQGASGSASEARRQSGAADDTNTLFHSETSGRPHYFSETIDKHWCRLGSSRK